MSMQLLDMLKSLQDLVEAILRTGIVKTVEESVNKYDPRNYGLQNLITLLAGGMS